MELDLIKVQWNVKDYAVDFIISSKYDHIVLEHKEEIIDKMEFLTKALKDGTYPFGNIRGLGHVPEKKTLLTVDLKASDMKEVKELIKGLRERNEYLEKANADLHYELSQFSRTKLLEEIEQLKTDLHEQTYTSHHYYKLFTEYYRKFHKVDE